MYHNRQQSVLSRGLCNFLHSYFLSANDLFPLTVSCYFYLQTVMRLAGDIIVTVATVGTSLSLLFYKLRIQMLLPVTYSSFYCLVILTYKGINGENASYSVSTIAALVNAAQQYLALLKVRKKR
ncbi:hypothetical protein SAMN05421736_11549 [Evansella caseinilytica]|uniref:Uncharacterized protein n=1 Tax=Evansella caseinilytica TaxID=1503961 RepID=A0A1H3TN68_9BACI|nr:hypothetical protein SAMN05421736_11549 [Evansella caseinilytica]